MTRIIVNGTEHDIASEPDTLLLRVLRDFHLSALSTTASRNREAPR